MANLYEINQEMLDCIDQETGEIIDVERLTALQMDFDEKIHNIALWIKNLRSDAEAFKKEKEFFSEREKRAKAKEEQLKTLLSNALNGSKFSDNQVEITFRSSKQVQINNIARIPREFLRVKTETEPDKTKISAALKQGGSIDGCCLVENKNIIIK